MTIGEATQLLTAIAAVGAVVIGWINSRKINEVHISTNSKMDVLLALTKEAATAEGVLTGRAQVKKEHAEDG